MFKPTHAVHGFISRSTKIDRKSSVVESAVIPNIGSAAVDFAEYHQNRYIEKHILLSIFLYLFVPSIARQHTCSYF